MANPADARQVLELAAANGDVAALVRVLSGVLDAGDQIPEPAAERRLGVPPAYSDGFEAGVRYVVDLALGYLRLETGTAPGGGNVV